MLWTFAMAFDGCGPGSSNYGPGHAKVSLVTEKRTVMHGSDVLLGVRFDLEPGWHLYWKGLNDTGYSPQITLDLPAGFRAGEILWPVPKRLVSPGNILDHVYDGHVTLLLPISVSAGANPGRYQLKGKASWLACHEACVPGEQELQLMLNVSSEADVAQANKEIDEAKALLPLPSRIQPLETSWQEHSLIIKRPGASHMFFFPDTASVPITDLIHAGDVQGEELRLATPDSSGQISGILGIETPEDTIYCLFKETLPQEP